MLTCGLNTWYVLEVGSDNKSVVVSPSYDGGPDLPASSGDIVRIRPRVTNWAIFREINSEILSMSSPLNGLFWTKTLGVEGTDWRNGTYDVPLVEGVPPDEVPWGDPIRVATARYRMPGVDAWMLSGEAVYQADKRVVRIAVQPPSGTTSEVIMAMPFTTFADLDDVADHGLNDFTQDIPCLGAAASLVMSFEGRRIQPMSQGDSRRAEEVSVGSGANLARQWRTAQRQAIDAEYARLLRLYGWQQAIPQTVEMAGRRHWPYYDASAP